MTDTPDLKALSEVATDGPWEVNAKANFCVQAPDQRGICSTGGYSASWIDGEVLARENESNAALICAAVNGFRNGTLIPASEVEAVIEHACAVVDAFSEYDQNECCDGRECGCQGSSVHDHIKHQIRARGGPQ